MDPHGSTEGDAEKVLSLVTSPPLSSSGAGAILLG